MSSDATLAAYASRLGDNALILGQRMIELVAASPELEEELANANFSLDYIGQALSLIHISEPTRPFTLSRMPSSA